MQATTAPAKATYNKQPKTAAQLVNQKAKFFSQILLFKYICELITIANQNAIFLFALHGGTDGAVFYIPANTVYRIYSHISRKIYDKILT